MDWITWLQDHFNTDDCHDVLESEVDELLDTGSVTIKAGGKQFVVSISVAECGPIEQVEEFPDL